MDCEIRSLSSATVVVRGRSLKVRRLGASREGERTWRTIVRGAWPESAVEAFSEATPSEAMLVEMAGRVPEYQMLCS